MKFLYDNDILDPSYVQEQIEMMERKQFLKKHPYKIWEGKDGKWYTYFPDKDKGRRLKKKSSKESIEEEIIKYWKSELENPTVRDVFEEWISRKLQNGEIKEPTFERYHIDFERFFGELAERKIKTVRDDEIEDFLEDTIVKFHLTNKSFANLRTLVYGIFKRAKKKKYILYSITELVKDMDISRRKFKSAYKEDAMESFTDEECQKIENYLLQNPDLTNMGLMLLFFTGIRIGELAALKWSDFDGQALRIQRTETRYKNESGKYVYGIKESPKTDAGIRNVVIPPQCMWLMMKIRNMNPFGEYIFEQNGKRVKTYTFRKRLYLACDKVEIPRRSPHKIRKTYASILLDNQIPAKTVKDLMGHTDIQCTFKYYAKDRKANDKKSEILGAIPEFYVSNE